MAGAVEVVLRAPAGPVVLADFASTLEELERGLMRRTSVPWGTGMLFFFPLRGYPSIWMADTNVPLDILWIDTEPSWRVVDIQRGLPLDRTVLSPKRAARFVLEVPAGFAEHYDVRVGSGVEMRRPR